MSARDGGRHDSTPTSGAGPPSGAPRAWPPAVQRMLDAKRLRVQPVNPTGIEVIWQKAVESAHDAEVPGLSIDGSLRSAYDAGHMAALALLAAHGLRTGSGPGHHEMAFAGAAALGGQALVDLVPDSAEIREWRNGSMYDPVIAGPEERRHALEWMRRTLPAIRRALVAVDRSLDQRLRRFP